MIEAITSWVQQNLQINSAVQGKLLGTFAILVLLLLLRPLVIALVSRRTDDSSILYRWRKGSEYLTLLLGVLVISRIWLTDTRSMATYLGLLSAGLAIALQDPIANFVGWFFLIWRRPFEVGDRIQIGDQAGDVIDIRFFQFTLMEIRNWVNADQSTGRVLHLPNKKVFNDGIANYSKGFAYIWHEIPVEITFESDWQKAKVILQTIAERHTTHLSGDARERVREAARRYMMNFENLTPIVYTKVNASGVMLTLRYLS
ncbi:MAG: mechanosensitive ion channel family protein, partial [Chloroflexi bacterium]